MLATNQLQMTAVDWLWKMHEAGVPMAARAIAVHATFFAITTTSQLVDVCGISENTVLKWKAYLVEGGWLNIPRSHGGRGIGIDVSPAFQSTPVTFTDIVAHTPPNSEEKGTKVWGGSEVNTPPIIEERVPKFEVSPPNSEVNPPQILGSLSRADIYINNNINNIYNNTSILLEEGVGETKTETPPIFELVAIEAPKPKKRGGMLKGSRLPQDWTLPQTWRLDAEQMGLSDAQIDEVALDFSEYWISKAGASAVKLDWHRTWLRWLRTALAGGPSGNRPLIPAGRPGVPKNTPVNVGAFFETPTGKEMVARLGREAAQARYLELTNNQRNA
jgi:hypothetical protein